MSLKNLARSLVRSYLASKLRRRSRPLHLSANGTLLVLAPHPDDEAFGCGGLIARRAAEGRRTVVAYFTSGEGSHRGHPKLGPADIAILRRAEATAAMASVGIAEGNLEFCGAPDGRLASLSEAEQALWADRLRDLVAKVAPTELILPCRDDGSSEHEAVFRLLCRALKALPAQKVRVLEVPVWSWWSPRLLAGVVARPAAVWTQPVEPYAVQKRKLIGSYPSQSEPTHPFSRAVLPHRFARAFDTAEEFLLEAPLD